MSTTATVMVGTTHQLRGELLPTHLVRLSERSRPAWVVHPLLEPAEPTAWFPWNPDRLLVDLLACIAVNVIGVDSSDDLAKRRVSLEHRHDGVVDELSAVTRGLNGLALGVTMWPGSSLCSFRSEFERLDRTDVEIFQLSWSRQFSHWGNQWVTSVDSNVEGDTDVY